MKAINKTRRISMALITVFTMGFTPMAFSENPVHPDPVQLKVIGNNNKQPAFLLSVKDTEANKFIIKVRDGKGELLYTETLKGNNISRQYQLDTDDEELNNVYNIRFEITKVKTGETFIYNITRNSRLVEETVIAKL